MGKNTFYDLLDVRDTTHDFKIVCKKGENRLEAANRMLAEARKWL